MHVHDGVIKSTKKKKNTKPQEQYYNGRHVDHVEKKMEFRSIN